MQAELHGMLAGVTAARHEQQEEQRKVAQLKHQHEDALQVSPDTQVFLVFCSDVPPFSTVSVRHWSSWELSFHSGFITINPT